MRETIVFDINKNSKPRMEKSFMISHPLKQLNITLEVEDAYALMAYVIVLDEKKRVRMQKLAGYGEKTLMIGEDSLSTSLGGYPGPILEGKWTLMLCIFTEYVEQFLKDRTFSFKIHISDELYPIKEAIGEINWTNYSNNNYIGSNDMLDRYNEFRNGENNDTKENKINKSLTLDSYDFGEIKQVEKRWYKGDFHTHTRLSDGKETVANAMVKANNMDMDFYVPTEHNVLHTGFVDTNICILPGVEITTRKGHFNLFGLHKTPEKLLELLGHMDDGTVTEQLVDNIMKEARQYGWIISINHPFLHIWKWEYDNTPLAFIQTLEIINDPTYPYAKDSNDKAIEFLDFLWQDGYQIYGVGGSDSHNLLEERYGDAEEPSIPGDPATYVYCEGLSGKEIMRQVKMGHMCVSRYIHITPTILVDQREYLPGDHISFTEEESCGNASVLSMNYDSVIEKVVNYHLKLDYVNSKPVVFIIVNGKKTAINVVKIGEKSYECDLNITINNKEYQWIRAEVRTEDGLFLGYVNPIYIGSKKPSFLTFKDAKMAMEEQYEN